MVSILQVQCTHVRREPQYTRQFLIGVGSIDVVGVHGPYQGPSDSGGILTAKCPCLKRVSEVEPLLPLGAVKSPMPYHTVPQDPSSLAFISKPL